MRKNKTLFGTDGIRGTANQFPIQPEIILRVGQAMGYLLRKHNSRAMDSMVLIGKDTRLSGYMLEQALASGLNSMGVWVQLTGPLPTPGIGFLARNMRASAGIVISASHNPYIDNGIKIFDENGFKISNEIEKEIESLVFSEDLNKFIVPADQVGRSHRIDDATGRYIVHVKNTFPLKENLDGLSIVLDCANGACYKVAPKIFEELGAKVIVLNNTPNGYNINENSGVLYPKKIQQAVIQFKADVGISLDGDGDRVMMIDENGALVNGDYILGICALNLQSKGKLNENKVIATYMSNMGLENMLNQNNIELLRTEVGDKNVVKYMKEHNVFLGGESSGHIIFLDQSTTGDGCIAALNVLAVMRAKKQKLSQLRSVLLEVPQVQNTIQISKKKELSSIPGYTSLIDKVEEQLKGRGRVYVRFSGTEPVVRVLIEGKNKNLIQSCANEVSHFLHKSLS